MIVLLWVLWGALMFALTQLSLLGWGGLLLYFVVGFGSGLWLHRITDDYRNGKG